MPKLSHFGCHWGANGELLGTFGDTFGCYFGDCFCVFVLAPDWMAYLRKVGHKGGQETVFGLHRRERIAYGPFSEKVIPGVHFQGFRGRFGDPLGLMGGTFGTFVRHGGSSK